MSTFGWAASSSIVGVWPESTAQSKAVESSFMRRVGSAPAASSRYAAASRCPALHAHCSAVRPSLLAPSTAAPISSRSQRTTR
eukprot:360179-Prymnesium_polylepis.1